MKLSLEKIIDKTDLMIIGIAVGVAALGTGAYAAIANAHSLKNAWEISTPISWSDSYWNALKTFVSAAKYSLPVSAIAGYVGSKILKR
jgi:hypothetical protein